MNEYASAEDAVPPDRNSSSPASSRLLAPRPLSLAVASLVVGLFAGFSIASEAIPPAPMPGASPQQIPQPTKSTIPGSGTYWVGSDVEAGLYRSHQLTGGCSWTRSADASGEADSVIAEHAPMGSTYVELREDEFFDTAGCATWRRVNASG
ncbi:hypothetical protein [Streptomyces albidoflavus]|uniref:hypothetical protein n=1 Tax=Streptomyces albidoflavus TaxID=1886 RepID=UPI003411129A